MLSELDIWRAANLLICQHGAGAELEAPKRADLMLDRGDDEGGLLWSRIRLAVEALQAPRGGEPNSRNARSETHPAPQPRLHN